MSGVLDSEEVPKMKKEQIKPFVWGMVVGAIVLVIVGFSAGWVMTSGSAQAKAEQMASKAIIDHLAPIAVAQFMVDPNRRERLKELKGLDYWKRDKYVLESGWATMPGSKEPNGEIDDEVVKRLMEIDPSNI
jgi:hypothetical protein